MTRTLSSAAFALALVAAAGAPALADVSKAVSSALKGQLIVTDGDLPTGKNDKDTIAKIKKAALKEVPSHEKGDVAAWTFHYTAFLAKAGSNKLRIEFIKGGKLAADQSLEGVDPKSSVLTGDIDIDEDEGLAKGSTYTVQLMAGSSVVAKTTLLMK